MGLSTAADSVYETPDHLTDVEEKLTDGGGGVRGGGGVWSKERSIKAFTGLHRAGSHTRRVSET